MQITVKFHDSGTEGEYSAIEIKSKKPVESCAQWVDMIGRLAGLSPFRVEFMLAAWLSSSDLDLNNIAKHMDSYSQEELSEHLTNLKKVRESVQPEVPVSGSTPQTESSFASPHR